MRRSRKTKDLPSLSFKRSSKKSMSSAPSRAFSVAQGDGATLGGETPGLDDIFEHINLACKRAAISNAPDPIAFLAQYLRVAADKRDAKLDLQEKQEQEHKEIIARRKAKEQAKHLEAVKAKRVLLNARRQQTSAFAAAFRKWPVEVAERLLRKFKVYFHATAGIEVSRNQHLLRKIGNAMNADDFDPRGPELKERFQERAHHKWKRAAVRSGENDPAVLVVLRGFLTLLGYTDELVDEKRLTTTGMDWGCMALLLRDGAFFDALEHVWLPTTLTRTRMIQALQCIDGIEWRISHINNLCNATHGPLALKALAYILTTAEAIGAETTPMYTAWGQLAAPTFETKAYFGPDYETLPTMSLLPIRNKHALPIRDCRVAVDDPNGTKRANDVGEMAKVQEEKEEEEGVGEKKAGGTKRARGYGKIKCIMKWSQEFSKLREIDASVLAIDWNGDIRDTVYHFKPTSFCDSGRLLETEEVQKLVAEGHRLRNVPRKTQPASPTQNIVMEAGDSENDDANDENYGPTGEALLFGPNPVLPSIPSRASPTSPTFDDDARPKTAKEARANTAKKIREAGETANAEDAAAAAAAATTKTAVAEDTVPDPKGQQKEQQEQPVTREVSNAELAVSSAQTTTWSWDEEFAEKCKNLRMAKSTNRAVMVPSKPDIIKHAEGFEFDLDEAPAEVAAFALVINAPVQKESLRSCEVVELEFYTEDDVWITGYSVDLETIQYSECVLGFVQRKAVPQSEASRDAPAPSPCADVPAPSPAADAPAPSPAAADAADAPAPSPVATDTPSPLAADAPATSPAADADADAPASLSATDKPAMPTATITLGGRIAAAAATPLLAPSSSDHSASTSPTGLLNRKDMFTVADFCNAQFQDLYRQVEGVDADEIDAKKFVRVRRTLGHKGLLCADTLGWEIHAVCKENIIDRETVNVENEPNFTQVLELCQDHLFEQGLCLPNSVTESEGEQMQQKNSTKQAALAFAPMANIVERKESTAHEEVLGIKKKAELSRDYAEGNRTPCVRSCINPFSMQPGDSMPIPEAFVHEDLILGVGWDPDENSRRPTDLDLTIFAYKGATFYDQVAFNTEVSGMTHHGDSQDGAGDGDDERISINLGLLDEGVTHLFILLTLYQGGHFNQLKGISARLVSFAGNDTHTRKQEKEVCRYDSSAMKDIPAPHNSLLIGHFKLDSIGWMFNGAHMSTQGQTRQAIHLMLYPHMSIISVVKAKAKWLAKHRRRKAEAYHDRQHRQKEELHEIELMKKRDELKQKFRDEHKMMAGDVELSPEVLAAMMANGSEAETEEEEEEEEGWGGLYNDGSSAKGKKVVREAHIAGFNIPKFFVPKGVPERPEVAKPASKRDSVFHAAAMETAETQKDNSVSQRLAMFAAHPEMMEEVTKPRKGYKSFSHDEAARTAMDMMEGVQDYASAFKQLDFGGSQHAAYSSYKDHDVLRNHVPGMQPSVASLSKSKSEGTLTKTKKGMSKKKASSASKFAADTSKSSTKKKGDSLEWPGHDDCPDELDRANHEWIIKHYKKHEVSHCEVCIRLQPIPGDMVAVKDGAKTHRALRRTDPVASSKNDHLKETAYCHNRAMQCKECEMRICSYCDMWNWDHLLQKMKRGAHYDAELFAEHFGKHLVATETEDSSLLVVDEGELEQVAGGVFSIHSHQSEYGN